MLSEVISLSLIVRSSNCDSIEVHVDLTLFKLIFRFVAKLICSLFETSRNLLIPSIEAFLSY
uniref:Uncharacterized protein n=1 Tax=Schistosoma curassoni TaxID=6186 RepID=A0A183JTE9_9TREM